MIAVAKLGVVLLSILALLACGGNTRQSTLGDLKYKEEKEEKIEFAKVAHEDVRKEYKELLDLFEDKQLKEQIERRIADVYMMEGVQGQNASEGGMPSPSKSYYIEAIKEYKKILEKYPNSPDNAEVLYQLAKAYDMEGRAEDALQMLSRLTRQFPWYPHIAEAWFRKADIHFNQKEYKQAEKAYLAVTKLNNEKLWINAHYMLAWAYYKQYQYEKSVNAFAFVLQQHLGTVSDLENLDKTVKPIVDDTLHSITLALDKLSGAETIAEVAGLADQHYVWMIYQDIGDYYLEKELYGDSVASFRAYVERFPQDEKAPIMHNKLIDAVIKGGFTEQSLHEKAHFVRAYGLGSDFSARSALNSEEIQTSLRVYLDELASHFHSKGQAHEKAGSDLAEAFSSASREPSESVLNKIAGEHIEAVTAYNTAAAYYQTLLETFPQDDTIDETRFFRAEVVFAAQRFDDALEEYERVAYQPLGSSAEQHRANAGYAAIISYQKLIDGLSSERRAKKWQAEAVDSMLRFAKTFDSDKRSPAVLTSAAEYLFGLRQYDRAISITEALMGGNQTLDKTLTKTAYGILAHSWFKLENYPKAELHFLNQRQLSESTSDDYARISERLATTLYKHSEELMTGDDVESSIVELLKIKALTPNSVRRVPAQFDAALLLMKTERWPAAIDELTQLNNDYAEHELAIEFPRKLALAYEKNGDWANAAKAYENLVDNDKDPVIVREALFLAGQMYEKQNDMALTIKTFKRYAHTYEEPFADRMEARYKIATSYGKINDDDKQQYWLRRIIQGHKNAGAEQSERSNWLAAWANSVYGDFYAKKFSARKLKQPIVESIAKRKEYLELASSYYQSAADSKLLAYVTESGFKIASLYQKLAADLRSAPPPSGLSAKDRALYISIIEEQAQPFDSLAIELYMANVTRAWDGEFNQWIDKSYAQLAILHPERFAKTELLVSYGDEIR